MRPLIVSEAIGQEKGWVRYDGDLYTHVAELRGGDGQNLKWTTGFLSTKGEIGLELKGWGICKQRVKEGIDSFASHYKRI